MCNLEPGKGAAETQRYHGGVGGGAIGEDAGPRGIFRTLKRHTPDWMFLNIKVKLGPRKKLILPLKPCPGCKSEKLEMVLAMDKGGPGWVGFSSIGAHG